MGTYFKVDLRNKSYFSDSLGHGAVGYSEVLDYNQGERPIAFSRHL
jgi:hypothetical protein